MRVLKSSVRRVAGSLGYAIRHVGTGVKGIDLLDDAATLLGGLNRPLLFDVGANVGQTTLAMIKHFHRGHIFAFEPSPATSRRLQLLVGSDSRVTIEPTAMGSVEGIVPFYVTKEYSVNDSILEPTWNANPVVVNVPIDTVDAYSRRHSIDRINLLKIDAQGYDLEVLRGACLMLAERRIDLFSCEANLEQMYRGQVTLPELLLFADDVGYRLVGFYEQTYVRNRLTYLDALFSLGQ